MIIATTIIAVVLVLLISGLLATRQPPKSPDPGDREWPTDDQAL